MSYPVAWIASPARPEDLSFASTAVIASAFSRCAYLLVRARDSAETDTKARSGDRLTTASPAATTTGISSSRAAGVCAAAMLPHARTATAPAAVNVIIGVVLTDVILPRRSSADRRRAALEQLP